MKRSYQLRIQKLLNFHFLIKQQYQNLTKLF